MNGKVTMSKKAFVAEHEDLLEKLKSGKDTDLKQEYKEQAAELKKVKSNNGLAGAAKKKGLL